MSSWCPSFWRHPAIHVWILFVWSQCRVVPCDAAMRDRDVMPRSTAPPLPPTPNLLSTLKRMLMCKCNCTCTCTCKITTSIAFQMLDTATFFCCCHVIFSIGNTYTFLPHFYWTNFAFRRLQFRSFSTTLHSTSFAARCIPCTCSTILYKLLRNQNVHVHVRTDMYMYSTCTSAGNIALQWRYHDLSWMQIIPCWSCSQHGANVCLLVHASLTVDSLLTDDVTDGGTPSPSMSHSRSLPSKLTTSNTVMTSSASGVDPNISATEYHNGGHVLWNDAENQPGDGQLLTILLLHCIYVYVRHQVNICLYSGIIIHVDVLVHVHVRVCAHTCICCCPVYTYM